MATFTTRRLKSGELIHGVQIRIKRDGVLVHSESESFPTLALAKEWARRRETELAAQRARGETLGSRMTLGQMVEWYEGREDKARPWGRTKRAELARLKVAALADKRADRLEAPDFIAYIRQRRKAGAGPATAGNDLVWLGQVFRAVRIELRMPVPEAALREAKDYLWQTRVVAKSRQRDRRLLPGEEARILAALRRRDGRARIPMADIVLFALATGRRQEEITRLRWDDLDRERGTCLLRDVKHPTDKLGNHRTFRLLAPALAIIDRQQRVMLRDAHGRETTPEPRIFPFEPKSAGAAFTRAVKLLAINDLHFHDLRHEATSRFFELGYSIHEVTQFTLHESWATLKRYTHLRPEMLADRSEFAITPPALPAPA